MRKTCKIILTTAALALAAPAWATPQICAYREPQDWMPLPNVENLARKLGYEKFFVQPEGGCWGIYTSKDGIRWEILVDPKTGEIVRQGET